MDSKVSNDLLIKNSNNLKLISHELKILIFKLMFFDGVLKGKINPFKSEKEICDELLNYHIPRLPIDLNKPNEKSYDYLLSTKVSELNLEKRILLKKEHDYKLLEYKEELRKNNIKY